MDYTIKFFKQNGQPYTDVSGYRKLNGRLLYLSITQSNIAFAVQQLSQFLANPMITNYKTAIRILQYIKSAPS